LAKAKWTLTREAFDNFLSWLSPDRDQAGRKYEELQQKLIRYFVCKACDCPEKLADQTIDRVTQKLESGRLNLEGDPVLISHGFARNIFLEWTREQQTISLVGDVPWVPPADVEEASQCLDACLKKMPEDRQQFICNYYQRQGQEKIRLRRSLAQQLGIERNALRIRALRIREVLHDCVSACLEGKKAKNVV